MRVVGFVLVWIAWWPLNASGQHPALPRIAWNAPAQCASEAQVRRAIAQWLARAPEPVDARALAVTAQAHRDGPKWSLALVLTSPSGRSVDRLSARDCDTLVQVVALKVAIAAESAAALRTLPTEPTAPEPSLRVFVRAQAGGAIGRLPNVSSGFGLASGFEAWSLRIELGLAYSPPNSARYEDPGGVGGDFQLLTGQVRGCVLPDFGGAQLPICLGAELGRLRGTGTGTRVRFESDQWFGEVVLGPALRLPLTAAWFLWLEVSGSVAFLRPRYQIRNLPELFRPDASAMRAWLGLELAL